MQLGRLQEARQGGLRVGVDLQFEQLMNDKELNQLANQLKRVYGSNKASPAPFHLHLLNLSKTGKTFRTCCEKIAGFEQFVATFEERSVREAFDPSEVVYISCTALYYLRGGLPQLHCTALYYLQGSLPRVVSDNHFPQKTVDTECFFLDIY